MKLQEFMFAHPDGLNRSKFPGFDLESGCFSVLRGENGAGKTSFLRYLKKNPNVFLPKRMKKDIVLLDQLYEHLLYPYKPVWWNISFPKILQNSVGTERAKHIAKDYISSFSIVLDLDLYPEGLSGGEKHMVLLSRFALMKQNTFLLDEPFTAIDIQRRKVVWDIIKSLVEIQRKDILIATHDPVEGCEVIEQIDFLGIRGKTMHLKRLKFK